MNLNEFLIISALLFSIGLYGALTKKHLVVVFMCVELMFNAVNLALAAFSKYQNPDLVNLNGHIFVIFIIAVAAAEIALGLAIVMSIYKNKNTIFITEIDSLKK
tara:strand:+ start:272 stop:583 length:312 start_codon:yes stop_codon:yes gene_type:complete